MDLEVARLLRERHTMVWMKDVLESIVADLSKPQADRDVCMNDVVSAFVCALMREKEFFRSEFAIGF
jgi:hypothetical protein